MNNKYNNFVKIADDVVSTLIKQQDTNPESIYYGEIIPPDKGFGETSQLGTATNMLLTVYYNQKSAYFQDDALLPIVKLYMETLLKEQYEDGTIDLRETNFHDATSVGFTIQVVAYTYRLMEKYSKNTIVENEIKDLLYTFIQNSAYGMKNGGFHTPNHRWVMASALSLCYNILGDDDCKRMAMVYLNEGIDCDHEGEYTERSAGIYNVVNNRSFIIIAEELGMTQLLEYVSRNLNMVLQYVEPDGSIFTLNSTRQDNGKIIYPVNYYENYLLMGYITRNNKFNAVADWICDLIFKAHARCSSTYQVCYNVETPNYLTRIMLDCDLKNHIDNMPYTPMVFDNYEHLYEDSGVVRYRKDNETFTITANNNVFFTYKKGSNRVMIKFASCFYSKGQFNSPKIVPTADGYMLEYTQTWGYVKPFPNGSETSVWKEMKHSEREHVNMQTLVMQVAIKTHETNGIGINFKLSGVDALPTKVELIFDADGAYETADTMLTGSANNSVILKNGSASYSLDGETITIDGGFAQHNYTHNMRGCDPAMSGKFTVYMTSIGDMDQSIHLY